MANEFAETAVWVAEPERLDRAVLTLGLARSRSRAQELIAQGHVAVDGIRADRASARVVGGAVVGVTEALRYVSRGALKLLAALDAFAVGVADRVCLDLGASTGGFTQVLCDRGARLVLAIDVGHDQLAPQLREDPRVVLWEGCNARSLTPDALREGTGRPEVPDVLVSDLSFISLQLVLPAIARVASPDADVILLVKPQLEVGRVRDGVVTDPRQHAQAITGVVNAAARFGLGLRGLVSSPIVGGEGNREFLAHFVRADEPDPTEWEERILALVGIGRGSAHVQSANGVA